VKTFIVGIFGENYNMELIMDINKAKNEINWVIKLVESVTSKEQLDCALKCFFLWDTKHVGGNKVNQMKSSLKCKFWAIYRTKESQFSYPTSVKN
jgi:hypothetical protein